jgi:hypothetical protein
MSDHIYKNHFHHSMHRWHKDDLYRTSNPPNEQEWSGSMAASNNYVNDDNGADNVGSDEYKSYPARRQINQF